MKLPKNPNERFIPGAEVLGGRYVVEQRLGEGGMGIVVAARHKAMGRLDAIKFLLPELITNSEILERFKREAQVAGVLKSPHVAHVYDSGLSEAGEPYIVMEYLEGQDLKSVLRSGPLRIDDAIEYLLQICHALAEAHKNAVLHRDLKPSNLFLTTPKNGDPYVKVLDFGVAKRIGGAQITDITAEDGKSGFLGTIPYMSPEHLRGAKNVDARTDIWALGVIAYELLTCKRPFDCSSKIDLVSKILDKEEGPVPLSTHRRDVPQAIEMVIGRCLAKNKEARYQTVQEFETALRAAAGIPAPPMRVQMASMTTSSPVELPQVEKASDDGFGVETAKQPEQNLFSATPQLETRAGASHAHPNERKTARIVLTVGIVLCMAVAGFVALGMQSESSSGHVVTAVAVPLPSARADVFVVPAVPQIPVVDVPKAMEPKAMEPAESLPDAGVSKAGATPKTRGTNTGRKSVNADWVRD